MKALGALGLGMVLLGQPAIAKERVQQTLTPVADTDASGRTRLVLKTDSDGRLELQV